MAYAMTGKPVATQICESLKKSVDTLLDAGVQPTLSIVRVGCHKEDESYERVACKRCESLGIQVKREALPEDISQSDLEAVIARINEDESVHACLLMRPLPRHIDENAICALLNPAKDIDGITPTSLFGVFAGKEVGFPPCTAEACLRLLEYYDCPLDGAHAVVLGRSLVVGKPASLLLEAKNATVSLCHSHTRDLSRVCKEADIIVSAVGRPGTVGADEVSDGQFIVDVGTTWNDEKQCLEGDVVADEVEGIVKALSPVPGGVGAVTTSALAAHVVQAAQRCV